MARRTTVASETAAAVAADLWTKYNVTWRFFTRLCSSVPANKDLVRAWLEAREPEVKPAGARSIEEINEEVLATLAEPAIDESQASMLIFQRAGDTDPRPLVMRAATVRAHMKDCARVLSAQFIGRMQGERAFSTRVVNGIYLDESTLLKWRSQLWIPVTREDGSLIYEPDGAEDKAVHVRGPRGEQLNALKRFEYVNEPTMKFGIKILGDSVKASDLEHLFSYGGTHGYAGERSDGEGRYEYTVERIPQNDPAK